MILTVGSYKGGTGKTTTAVALALLLAADGPVVLVDADAQQSATTWHETAVAEGYPWPGNLSVVPWREPMTLPPAGLTHAVIDTPPGNPERFRAAVNLSDSVLITTGARYADAIQLGGMAREVEKAAGQRPITWGVLLTLYRLRTGPADSVRDQIDAADFPRLTTIIPLLNFYAELFGTVPKQFKAYADVLRELKGE